MPLKIIKDDITKLTCDAIVNAANNTLLGGGGVDGAIHNAAGRELLLECMKLGGCKTGEAKITKGYNLPSKYVIHTVGPVWSGGNSGEEQLLRSCYQNSLAIAEERGFESVAFPLISSGAYGYPKDQALEIAVDEISSFLMTEEMLVYLVIYDNSSYQINRKLFENIASFIDDKYIDDNNQFDTDYRNTAEKVSLSPFICASIVDEEDDESFYRHDKTFSLSGKKSKTKMSSLDDALSRLDESFSEMLLRKIDEKGLTDAQCYKKANIDRKLFSKIRSDKYYRPSKTTAIAFAIALELPLEESKDILKKAGFALSHSNKFDVIIEYFITNGNYNVFEINEALFAFDQPLLGA